MTAPRTHSVAEKLIIAPALDEDCKRTLWLVMVNAHGERMADDMDALKAVCIARLLDDTANGDDLRTWTIDL